MPILWNPLAKFASHPSVFAVARGGEGPQCPWLEKKAIARGGEGSQRPWQTGKQSPRAEKRSGAPSRRENQLPRAEKGLSAPGDGCFPCQLEEVGFQGVYLVHLVWL